jgi:hypothetical protein
MALFYFDIRDGSAHTRDKIGVELAGLTEAKVEAAVLTAELLKDRPRQFWDEQEWKLTVEDEHGLVLFTIGLSAIVAPAAQTALLPIRAKLSAP